jgi:hypothetical protein
MGFTVFTSKFLLDAKLSGWCPGDTITLGRQNCYVSPRDWRDIVQRIHQVENGCGVTLEEVPPMYMDAFFASVGASRLDALDASDFEGANIVHDMNLPIHENLRARYDSVIDAGTLEHVFNVGVAFANVMELLRVGGSFFGCLPANNWCGHGFYQFSPEFVYRTFCEANGFKVEKLLVAPAFAGGKWLDGPAFSVKDPDAVGDRVDIKGPMELVLLVWARRERLVTPFSRWPQQSDYAKLWPQGRRGERPPKNRIPNRLKYLWTRMGGVGRLAQRFQGLRNWNRQCDRNPFLAPYSWICDQKTLEIEAGSPPDQSSRFS